MTNCDKYIEQISCMLDGEINPEQEAELRAHIDTCPDCKRVYDAFMAISDEDELVPVPAGLSKSIMAGIKAQEKGSRPRLFVFGRFTAIAACLAILIYAGAQNGLFAPKSSNNSESDFPSTDEFTISEAASDRDSTEAQDATSDENKGTAMFTVGTGSDSAEEELLTSGSTVSDPTIQAIHKELDSKLRLGSTEIYEGDVSTSKRFVIAGAEDADALLRIFDCAYLCESTAQFKLSTTDYTLIFADGSKLLIWFLDSAIYCRLPDDSLYVAIGTPNTFSTMSRQLQAQDNYVNLTSKKHSL